MTSNTSWSRLRRPAAEFGVIVLGVLVALSVDAWWDSVQERETERAMLEALADELQVAEETLLDYLEVDSAIIHNADLVLGTPGLSSDSVSVLLNRFYYTIPRQAALPTIEEATTTGRLRLFRNADLRVRITEFMANLRTLTAYHVQTEAQWNEVARPILYESTDFDELVAGGNPHWGTTGRPAGQLRGVTRTRISLCATSSAIGVRSPQSEQCWSAAGSLTSTR